MDDDIFLNEAISNSSRNLVFEDESESEVDYSEEQESDCEDELVTQDDYIERVIELATIAHKKAINFQANNSAVEEGVIKLSRTALRNLEDEAEIAKQRYLTAFYVLNEKFIELFDPYAHAEKLFNQFYFSENFEESLADYFEEFIKYQKNKVEPQITSDFSFFQANPVKDDEKTVTTESTPNNL